MTQSSFSDAEVGVDEDLCRACEENDFQAVFNLMLSGQVAMDNPRAFRGVVTMGYDKIIGLLLPVASQTSIEGAITGLMRQKDSDIGILDMLLARVDDQNVWTKALEEAISSTPDPYAGSLPRVFRLVKKADIGKAILGWSLRDATTACPLDALTGSINVVARLFPLLLITQKMSVMRGAPEPLRKALKNRADIQAMLRDFSSEDGDFPLPVNAGSRNKL